MYANIIAGRFEWMFFDCRIVYIATVKPSIREMYLETRIIFSIGLSTAYCYQTIYYKVIKVHYGPDSCMLVVLLLQRWQLPNNKRDSLFVGETQRVCYTKLPIVEGTDHLVESNVFIFIKIICWKSLYNGPIRTAESALKTDNDITNSVHTPR
jgi:hypothetical protein